MPDRTEALLEELVELQRRTVANQERAIAHQAESIAVQARAVARQKSAMRVGRIIAVVFFIIAGMMLVDLRHFFIR